jgi:hypothetical protein
VIGASANDRKRRVGARNRRTLITADLSPRVEPTAEIVDRGHGEAREQAGPQEAEQDRAIGADQRALSVEMTGVTNHDATPNPPGCNELIGVRSAFVGPNPRFRNRRVRRAVLQAPERLAPAGTGELAERPAVAVDAPGYLYWMPDVTL